MVRDGPGKVPRTNAWENARCAMLVSIAAVSASWHVRRDLLPERFGFFANDGACLRNLGLARGEILGGDAREIVEVVDEDILKRRDIGRDIARQSQIDEEERLRAAFPHRGLNIGARDDGFGRGG